MLEQQEALGKGTFSHRRDLHDQLGANLTQVALLSEMAEADKHSPAEMNPKPAISQTARRNTRSLDEIVWRSILPTTRWRLVNYVCKYAQDFSRWRVRYRAEVPVQLRG